MIRGPPRSPPFPFTTLFRALEGGRHGIDGGHLAGGRSRGRRSRALPLLARRSGPLERRERTRTGRQDRSEEHTSELQSRQYLVCRLLLEKKNPVTPTTTTSS